MSTIIESILGVCGWDVEEVKGVNSANGVTTSSFHPSKWAEVNLYFIYISLNFEGQPLFEALENKLFLNTKTWNSDLIKTFCILNDPVVLVVVAGSILFGPKRRFPVTRLFAPSNGFLKHC